MAEQTAAMIAAQQGSTGPIGDPEDAAKAARRRYQEAALEWEHETSQRRRPLYADVEDLINIGFLAHSASIGPLQLSFRSMSPGDRFMLAHRIGGYGSSRMWKTWSVATTLWMVNGVCVLEDSDAPSKMYPIISALPETTVDTLYSIVLGLHNRTTTALMRTEAYCYEPYSRVAWRMCGREVPSLGGIGSVPGVHRLGMNHIQRVWVAFNLSEDDRDQLQREWASAKLVASATSPKGIRKLNAADDRLQKQEDHRRREAIEKMVRFVLYGEEEEVEQQMWRVRVQGQIVEVPAVQVARTPEAMQDEFRAWVAGEKDWHDIIVDTYKDRIRAKFEDERQTREEALSDLQRQPGVTGGTQMVGYTLEQLRDLRPGLASPRSTGKRVFEGGAPSRMYQKYVETDAQPGRLRADEGGVWEAPIPHMTSKSLHEQVASRQPALSDSPTSQPIDITPVEDGG